MKKFIKLSGIVLLAAALMAPALTSCDNDDFNTNQYVGGVHLNSFGPSPVARGGQLRFLGSGMDQIVKITLPGAGDITDIEVINSGEIRITVPQTAEPGYVVLHYANGEIKTKTLLTFSEPISLDSFSPTTVKPGEELTLTGEYLNLIHEVCFTFDTDSVNVYEADFTAHSRNEIKLIVPAEALSGPIALSDAKEMPNVIKSETDLTVVTPSVDAPLDLSGHKGGDVITVKGHDFDLIAKIEVPEEQYVEFTYNPDEDAVTFTLPDNVADGPVVAIAASGAHVAIANIGVVVPTEMVANPSTGLRGGDVLVINGLNMDQVVSVVFPGVDEAFEPSEADGSHIKLTWPDAARSGDISLNLKSGKIVIVPVETAKPQVTGFNPTEASAAADVTLHGKNLDLVSSIAFPGGTVVASKDFKSQSADAIAVEVPSTASTGALTLNMANGEIVETPALTVLLPVCAYVTEVTTTDPTAGDVMVVQIANEDKLTGVQVNGSAVQYILTGQRLMISLPTSCGKGTQVTLISSNGSISYTYDVIPATHVENVIMDTKHDLGDYAGEDAGGAFRLYKDSFESAPAGAKLIFSITPYAATQLQLNDANWGQMDMIDVNDQSVTTVEWELTAERLQRILTTNDGWSETAMVIQGKGCVVNRVSLAYERSLEETVWTGNANIDGWGGMQELAWNEDFINNTIKTWKAGQKLRVYYNSNGPEPKIKIGRGADWSGLPGAIAQSGDPEGYFTGATGDNQHIELTLTPDDLDMMINKNGIIIQGNNCVLTKITIE